MVHPCRENMEKLIVLLRTVEIDENETKEDDEENHSLSPRPSLSSLPSVSEDVAEEEAFSRRGRMLQAAIINLTALVSAIFIPGVQIVWTFMGSTVACVISYILPTLFYLKIKRMQQPDQP